MNVSRNSFDFFIFDLDRTLYPYSSPVLKQVDIRIAKFCQKILNITYQQAHNIRQKYYHEYGATLSGLMQQHQIDPEDYLQQVHNVNYSDLNPCQELEQSISRLSAKKFIYTNGTLEHAQRVLSRRGIRHLFSDIHDIRAADLISKPSKDAFQNFLLKYNISADKAIFFDDSLANTKVAKSLGIYSVLVYEGKTPTPYDHNRDYSDETIYSLSKYLKKFHHVG